MHLIHLIYTFVYQFRRHVLVGGIVEFVLHCGEKCVRNVICAIIVYARRKDVRYFLIEVPLAHPYVADTLKKLAEITATVSLKTVVVECKTLDREFVQMPNGPLAKANGNLAPNPHSDGENHVEVVVR